MPVMKAQERSVKLDGITYKYRLRRSRRARHILLHVDEKGMIELVVPWQAAFKDGEKFIAEKAEWIRRALASAAKRASEQPRRQLATGEMLPILGERVNLRVVIDSQRKRSSFGEEMGEVSVFVIEQKQVREVLVRWYRKRARQYFTEQVAELSAQLKVKPGPLAVSGAKSQWGSCIPTTGRISLNWRLLLGPPEVAQYVVAHEVAHLRIRGHTSSYWQLVEQLDRQHKKHRGWLRRYGHTLQL